MFRDSIPGLDKVFKSDIQAPKVVLITGPPGSMKTSFCYTLMSKYLEKHGEFGLYATMEETVSSHLRNMESLGIKLSLNMQVSDLTDIREVDSVISDGEETDYIMFLEKMVRHFKKTRGEKFTVFALDSLGALYSLMEDQKHMRKKMFSFFKMLRDLNLITFVIMERSLGGDSQLLGNEGFLADGIVMLGLDRSRGKLVRYIQIEKMRASSHSMEKHAIDVKDGGIAILGPIFEG
ncbi:MAG: ATPase domain-containing protein [Candidatus Thermoplasmatota archaeon]|nr:ATPase domain-containing protein [Candidatus Thermoplasmatota archaeon]